MLLWLPDPILVVCNYHNDSGISVQEKTDLACLITIILGHRTRLRDEGNLFFSLSERGKLN
jgi:hypothetical protein